MKKFKVTLIVLFVLFAIKIFTNIFIAKVFKQPSQSMANTIQQDQYLIAKLYSYGIPTPIFMPLKGNGHLVQGEGPKRGDVVVFRYPKNRQLFFAKRCVATQEDEIIYAKKALYIHFKNGDNYIKNNYPKEKIVEFLGKLWVKNPYMDKFKGIHYDKSVNLMQILMLYHNEKALPLKPLLLKELPTLEESQFNAFYTKVPKNQYFMLGDNRDHSNDSRFWGSVPYSHIVGKLWKII